MDRIKRIHDTLQREPDTNLAEIVKDILYVISSPHYITEIEDNVSAQFHTESLKVYLSGTKEHKADYLLHFLEKLLTQKSIGRTYKHPMTKALEEITIRRANEAFPQWLKDQLKKAKNFRDVHKAVAKLAKTNTVSAGLLSDLLGRIEKNKKTPIEVLRTLVTENISGLIRVQEGMKMADSGEADYLITNGIPEGYRGVTYRGALVSNVMRFVSAFSPCYLNSRLHKYTS